MEAMNRTQKENVKSEQIVKTKWQEADANVVR